jgi:Predicted Ser/Thr protein kinase
MSRPIPVREVAKRADLLGQLSYPHGDPRHSLEALQALERIGVEAVTLDERGLLKLLGKGFRNIVLEGVMAGERVAVKIRRSDYVSRDASREAAMHGLANRLGVGPRLLGWCGPVLVMELVSGPDLSTWLATGGYAPAEAKEALLELALQCFRLDQGGLDHGELSDARRHVLVVGNRPVIIDFGSARITPRPKNLTSILSYLFGRNLGGVRSLLGLRTPRREALRRYKENPSEEQFVGLMRMVGLLEG